MANPTAPGALLLTAFLVVAVALSGTDARPNGRPDNTPTALPDANAGGNSTGSADAGEELCSECEKPKAPPPCSCEEPKEPEMKCNKVHAVRDGETCYSMGQCAGLGQDDFLRFNPNICCDHLFVGQWVCLDATCDDY